MKRDSKKPLLSVVMCVVSKEDCLSRALNALFKNSFKQWEFILVDQSRNDEVKSFVFDFIKKRKFLNNFIYIKDKGTGVARARNIAWKKAMSDIICFTDDDAYVDKSWLREIYLTFRRYNSVAIVGGKIVAKYNENNNKWEIPNQWKYILPYFDAGDKSGDYKNGALPPCVNYSIRKKIIKSLGGFNEKLGPNSNNKVQVSGEESDLSFRVMKIGYRVFYNPKVKVTHPVPLERQNNNFLVRRLFTEGMTDVYIRIINGRLSFFDRLGVIKWGFKELISLYKNKPKMEEIIYIGSRARILGTLYGLFFKWR